MKSNTPALDVVIASSRHVRISTVEALQARILAHRQKIAQIDRLIGDLLQIEAPSKDRLVVERAHTMKLLGDDENELKQELEIGRINYPILDKSAFAGRNSKGYPNLAPFQLNNAECTISNLKGKRDSIPESCSSFYDDVKEKLRLPLIVDAILAILVITTPIIWVVGSFVLGIHIFNIKEPSFLSVLVGFCDVLGLLWIAFPISKTIIGYSNKERFISARFEGIIPNEIRNIIRSAQSSGLFKEVFLLAEVPKWKKATRPTPQPIAQGDPLVIGWDGINFRLIAAFDTTPIEQYIADEFSTKVS